MTERIIRRTVNLTPYTVRTDSIFPGVKESIPSSGTVTLMAVSSPADQGRRSRWDPESFVLSGVPEELDDEAVYIVSPSVMGALRAAGYDMSRFCAADSVSPEVSDGPAASLSCCALNHLQSEDAR